MGRHQNLDTGIVVSVDDSKDDRFNTGWKPIDEVDPPKPTAKKAAARKTSS